jgi:hypothetical protein
MSLILNRWDDPFIWFTWGVVSLGGLLGMYLPARSAIPGTKIFAKPQPSAAQEILSQVP